MAVKNDIKLWLYPGANPNSTPDAWEPYFVDISAYVRRPGQDGGRAIQYSAGKQDESTTTDAGQMTLTLDNRDGRFSTEKIDGPYYGLIDTNTPIRLGVTAVSDPFTRTVSNGWGTISSALSQSWAHSGTLSNWSTDGTKGQVIIPSGNTFVVAVASNGTTRDVDLVTTVTPSATATGAAYGIGHMMHRTDSSNMVYTTLEFNTAGNTTVKIRQVVAGVTTELAASNPIPSSSYSAGNAWKIRSQADGDAIRVKVWPVSGSEPTAWMLTTTQDSLVGNSVGLYIARFNGNTNSGVASLLGVDDFIATTLEWTGYVNTWPMSWDITANNSWAAITAGGILRRLRQGTNPVQSPLRRQLAGTANCVGYWPLEDGASSLYFTPAVGRVPYATFVLAEPASENTLAGGGPAPTLSDDSGSISATVGLSQGGTGYAAMFLVKMGSMPSVKTRIVRVRGRGPATIVDFSLDSSNTYLEVLNGDGSLITSATNAIPSGIHFDQWMAINITSDNTDPGAGVTTTRTDVFYHQVGSQVYYNPLVIYGSASLSTVTGIRLTGNSGTAFGHIWLGQNTLPFVTNDFTLVSSGYATELASDRFSRVCREAGIPYSVVGASSLASEAMGAQKEGSTLAILQSCADADYGVISERGGGLEFVPRASRWNIVQTMGITLAARQIGAIPAPVRDDQRLRNKWTVTRTGGSSGTFQDDTSVARNGTAEDSVTINTFDDSVLVNHAAWRVAIGIGVRARWPSIVLNFANSPELMVYWRQRVYGWRLGITTGLTQVKGNEPDLIVEGYQASLDPDLWVTELNCTDAEIWTAAVTDDTGIYGRVDNEACTSTSLISATALSLPVTTTAPYPVWDTTSGLWSGGVDLNVGGERVTATGISTGVSPAQTFTLSARGVGGYAASHPSGTKVSLWYPAPVAL
jgi:hypothetical protein